MSGTGKDFSVLLSGVGGQGLVLLSNIIGTACASTGIHAITGEQHGLSQRSGMVSIHLRIGDNVTSPLIPAGYGDAILSLEALESLRYIEYLKENGIIISNQKIMNPIYETSQFAFDRKKPLNYIKLTDIESQLKAVTPYTIFLDALSIARDAGNHLTENIVLLGALSTLEVFPVNADAIRTAIADKVPQKAVDANLKAFSLGAKAAYDQFCNIVPCRKI
jgi:indolepyruvate ferredoxin oxidoreductase beta subunit